MKINKLILAGLFSIVFSLSILAQGPPDPPGSHGEDGDQTPGGNAPVGSGIAILLSLGAAYGGRKLYQLREEGLKV